MLGKLLHDSLHRLPIVKRLRAELEETRARLDRSLSDLDAARAVETTVRAERDAARTAEETLRAENTELIAARDAARTDCDAARAERDAARAACDDARGAEETLRTERTSLIAERDAALAVRDAARTAEETLRAENALLITERDAARTAERALFTARAATIGNRTMPPPVAGKPSDRFRLAAEQRSTEPRAVIVPVCGAIGDREIRVTQPFFEDYCRKIGADLRIVDVPETTPDLLVKASLCTVAQEYRRFTLMDADVLIRPGCPDLFSLVPADRLGGVMEGRWTDRKDTCAELAQIYGRGSSFPAEHYIDTGVMVMSAAHLPLMESLMQTPIVTHPRCEQDAINAALYLNEIPLHGLAREYNWIPYTPEEFDWRWCWIFHIADNWRARPRSDTAWQLHSPGDDRLATSVPLSPRHCRLPCLVEVSEQMRGKNVRVFHPADMGFHSPGGRLLITPDEAAAMWCAPSTVGAGRMPPVYGPYATLEAGRWAVSLMAPDGRTPADESVVVDIVHDLGNKAVRRSDAIGPVATFEIFLENDVNDLEMRIYRTDTECSIGSIMLLRIGN